MRDEQLVGGVGIFTGIRDGEERFEFSQIHTANLLLNVFRYSYFSYKENCTIYGIEKVQRGRIVFYEWVVVGPMTLPKWNNSNPHAWVIPLGKVVLPQGNRANGCEM